MLLHLLYIIAFTTLAFLAVGNLIRSMMTLGMESQRGQTSKNWTVGNPQVSGASRLRVVPHPEFLDTAGNVINEPLLVMRSVSVEDAREQLDALYESSPGANSSSDRCEEI
ncbi:MAG: DUF2973 domain-containing protein [Stenomitos rutilans HA7619-LM2]|jgi:hypothetical protein|nr:DUF2973 domain-containing protein [Stenomitos rutilans HA7619-LM2]